METYCGKFPLRGKYNKTIVWDGPTKKKEKAVSTLPYIESSDEFFRYFVGALHKCFNFTVYSLTGSFATASVLIRHN